MKSNLSEFKFQKNSAKPVKVKLLNNICKTSTSKKLEKSNKTKIIKNIESNNPINANMNYEFINYGIISNKKNNNLMKKISNYISINKSILLSAYEESLRILFDSLKLYLKNDILYFNNLKDNFIKNVQNFYKKNKNNFSFIPHNNNIQYKKEEIKIDNYLSYNNNIKNKNLKQNYSTVFHKKNKSHINKSINKMISSLSNNSINKSNISNHNSRSNNKNSKNKKNKVPFKNSLYSLIKGKNKPLITNSPVKDLINKKHKFSLLNNFIDFNKNKKNCSGTVQNGSSLKTEKAKNGKDIKVIKYQSKKIDIQSNNQNSLIKKENNNYITNISNNIYYNNIISQIPDKINNENNILNNNDLISCIKNTLDENLKGMFDFSYESFLNKESERE